MCGAACLPQRMLDRRERIAIVVIPAYILEQREKMLEGTLVVNPARLPDAVRHSFLQTLQRPLRKCDAYDGTVEHSAVDHRIECGEDHLVSEIARYAINHKSIGMRSAHEPPFFLVALS